MRKWFVQFNVNKSQLGVQTHKSFWAIQRGGNESELFVPVSSVALEDGGH